MITLGAKTDYSFMRGFGTPAQWLARCKELGVTRLALTDYCSTWGHAPFAMAFKGSGVELLFGVQLPVVPLLVKDPAHDLVTLIAKSPEGLQRLYEAVGLAGEQSYYRSRLTWEQVGSLNNDCWVIVNEISIGNLPIVKKHCKGAMIGARPQRDRMLSLVKEGKMPVVPMHMPVMPQVENLDGYRLVQAISAGVRVGELDGGSVLPLLRRAEYEGAMRACGVEPLGDWFDLAARILPFDFPKASKIKIAPTQADAQMTLRKMCYATAQTLGLDIKVRGPYFERFERELGVIRDKQFEDYFLFIADVCQWARGRMLVGPARGSSAGSLLCYLLGITTVDPLKYGTLFERFIDITRPDWPDIDIDFPDTRRDEVLAYMKEKYGAAHFARLGTISEFGGKSAINDTAKATGVEYMVGRELGKVVEGYVQAAIQVQTLAEIFGHDPQAKAITDKYPGLLLASTIEGHARHSGVHAAGVVVSREAIRSFGTVDKNDTLAMDMKAAEKVGLIKMDALGLRTLSVIQDCCDQVAIDPRTLYNIDFLKPEPKVLDVFNNDRVTGVFQFEGHAVRQLMKAIKVETFDDLCALTSLARPGPLSGGAAGNWVKRRSGQDQWEYLHPSLEPHTKSTFGVITYQEQAMSIVRDLGAFDEPSVNKFRRAIGKKEPEVLKAFREQFLAGCATWHERPKVFTEASVTTGPIPEEIAADLWDEMCEFGSYAFNLSHAVAYAMISYSAAHLKAHYPLEFAVATLRGSKDDDQGKQVLRELEAEGFSYIPFDAALSHATWAAIDGRLVGGFDSVKGIGDKSARELLSKREADPENWLGRLTESQRNKLTRPDNTPWHALSYFGRTYAKLYDDPENYKTEATPAGVTAPVMRIKDIPPAKGTYRFLARLIKKMVKDKNSPEQLAKRDGEKLASNTTFVNLIWSDDTGEIGTTINRFKVGQYGWLLDSATDGRDFLVRGTIIGDERRWLFIDGIVELTPQKEEENGRQDKVRPKRAAKGSEGDGGNSPARAGGAAGGDVRRTRKRAVKPAARARKQRQGRA